MRRRVIVATLAVAVLMVLGITALRLGGDERRTRLGARPLGDLGSATIDSFFERYVQDDGRVVRHDEGGDTVSEGQAYALIMAAAEGDRDRFDRVWKWTRTNLQRRDGLLSWRWRDGKVVDDAPASDADLDAARALVMAGRHFGDTGLVKAGGRMGRAVLEHETVAVEGDDLLLVAGPWAKEDRVVNPSYVSPCTYKELASAAPDPRWGRLERTGYAMVDSLLAGDKLPPDWARSEGAGDDLQPTGPPENPDAPPRYGLDAARLPFRLAEVCDGRGPDLAARLWPLLRALDGHGAAIAYSLDGKRLDGNENPLGLVAAASAATAAGEAEEAERLLSAAAELEARHSTYYGAAWLALGHALLRPASGGDGR